MQQGVGERVEGVVEGMILVHKLVKHAELAQYRNMFWLRGCA